MNWTHVHLLLNHFPTIGMIVGLSVFFSAVVTKSDDLKRTSLGIFFFIALLSIPTFVTGTAAELALQKTPQVSVTRIQLHETAAFEALGVMELTGALAWLGLWQYRRVSRLPRGTLAAVLVTGLLTFGMMTRAANIGGEIRHPEIRENPGAAEPDSADPPLARVIGDAMVNLAWGWPASETVHFIGLSLLFGVVLLVDLRMLGFMKGIPYSALHRLLPWGMLGFGINVLTGMLFFIGAPPDFYVTNATFFWKLGLILVAGANALYFTVFDQPWTLGADDMPPVAAKVAAASGIFLWLGVIFCGQMLPFLGHSF
ncbi:MAG: hypothetical protein JO307_07170 [Bryobacterales bacterium]|nr:hypothetical protein [Bryobacterales bacterium]MBV9400497.1 hypothetical protein [Bryobacterales bacterium]